MNADANVPEPELIEIEKHYQRHTRLTTDKLPDDLPVEIVEHDLSEDKRVCPSCGGKLYVMGRDSRRELQFQRRSEAGQIIETCEIYQAYEKAVGHPITRNMIYYLLHRHQ